MVSITSATMNDTSRIDSAYFALIDCARCRNHDNHQLVSPIRYAGGHLDRASRLRQDEDWVSAAFVSDASRPA